MAAVKKPTKKGVNSGLSMAQRQSLRNSIGMSAREISSSWSLLVDGVKKNLANEKFLMPSEKKAFVLDNKNAWGEDSAIAKVFDSAKREVFSSAQDMSLLKKAESELAKIRKEISDLRKFVPREEEPAKDKSANGKPGFKKSPKKDAKRW